MINVIFFLSRSNIYKILLVFCFTLFVVVESYNAEKNIERYDKIMWLHKKFVDAFYRSHKSLNTSKLGAVLFKNKKYPSISKSQRNKKIVILFWKYWDFLKSRHVFNYGHKKNRDPLEGCSVNNCVFTGDNTKLNTADAVIVHVQHGVFPKVNTRNQTQRWIFLNDEAPNHAFTLSKKTINFRKLHKMFNWSMTYDTESDVPVAYGRTVPLKVPKFPLKSVSLPNLVPNWRDKNKKPLITILMSHCVKYRMQIIADIGKYTKIDVYGRCSNKKEKKNKCPGHFSNDCPVLKKYLFYLALENAKCKQYFTEKLFYNAYYKGAIPIIQGPPIEECKMFLPPNSYLHVDNYLKPKDLVDDIIRISNNKVELLRYHLWRNHFKVANEHGFFGSNSFHLCRVCEAMNYNDKAKKVYNETDLARFFDTKLLCRK